MKNKNVEEQNNIVTSIFIGVDCRGCPGEIDAPAVCIDGRKQT